MIAISIAGIDDSRLYFVFFGDFVFVVVINDPSPMFSISRYWLLNFSISVLSYEPVSPKILIFLTKRLFQYPFFLFTDINSIF